MNEELKSKGAARIEFVPFPGVEDEPPTIDPVDEGTRDDDVKRSKPATGWAASGLAGALRRSRRSAES